jgi:hypothetical protein
MTTRNDESSMSNLAVRAGALVLLVALLGLILNQMIW